MKTFFAMALAAILFAGCGQPAADSPAPEPIVSKDRVSFPQNGSRLEGIRSTAVEMQPVPLVRLNGRLTWNEDRTVRVYTPFAGRVERILVQTGQTVARGQALAVIASPDFGQTQADARRAESDHALAEKNLQRMRELEQHGVAPRKDLQTAEADATRTRAEFERARKRLVMYGAAAAGIDQTYTLTSPIAGTVVERNINPGQELRPDQVSPPLFVVTDPTSLWAQFDASERDLALLRPGKTITVRSPAWRDEEFSARVETMSDFLDPATRAIKIRARLDNTARKLKGEMFVTADVDADGARELLVPAKAVYFQNEKNYLFIDEGGGSYLRREVQTGDVRRNLVEILAGLNEGEKVVTEGSLMLQQVMQPRRVQK
ncbi:MAG: efflux RND transporter periplasmic adaptor subunit [Burkholderiales bacterium]|nr:efflux RND transporter periplasmic adaptor subunit [Burkholderiales bacterium]